MAKAPERKGDGAKGPSLRPNKPKYVPKAKRTHVPRVNARPDLIARERRESRKRKAQGVRKLFGFGAAGINPPKVKEGEKGYAHARPTGAASGRETTNKSPKQLQAEERRARERYKEGKRHKGGQDYPGQQAERQKEVGRRIRDAKAPDPAYPERGGEYDGFGAEDDKHRADKKRAPGFPVQQDPKKQVHSKDNKVANMLRQAKAKRKDDKLWAKRHRENAQLILNRSFGTTKASSAGKAAAVELGKAAAREGGGVLGKVARVAGPAGTVVGVLLGSDPLEAATFVPTEKAGGPAAPEPKDVKRRKDGSYVKYAKDAKKNYRLSVKKHTETKARAAAKARASNPLAKYAKRG